MEEYKCELCNTIYKTDKTLLYHKKKYHPTNDIIKHICKYCNKELGSRQAKNMHESKFCKQKDILLQKQKEEDEVKQIKLELLRNKLKTSNTKIINNTQNNNTQNNNFNIMNFNSDIPNMTDDDKLGILKSIKDTDTYPIVELTKKIYKDDRFITSRNVAITNLRSNYALACNVDILDKSNKFEIFDKYYIISEFIAGKKVDISNYLKDYDNTNKLTKVEKDKLKEYIYKLNDPEDRCYSKQYKDHHDKIGVIIYNSRDSMKLLLNAEPHNDSDDEL